MTLTLPDSAAPEGLTARDLLMELACALYARGRVGKIRGAELAGVDFLTFQGALAEHGLLYSEEMLDEDVRTMKELWPA